MDKRKNKMKKQRLFYWSGPHVNVQEGNFIYDRLKNDNYEIVPFYDYIYGTGSNLKERTRRYRKNLLSIFLKATKNDIIFTHDHTRSWVLALLFSLFLMKRTVYINNFMYEGGSALKLKCLRLAFRNMKVAVNSVKIKEILLRDLGKGIKDKVYVIPDCVELLGNDFEDKWKSAPHESQESYVFTGGNTRRDFKMVIDIANKHPKWNFVIVAPESERNTFSEKNPINAKVYFSISTDDFLRKMIASKVVFIPLKSEFQGGQLVLFQAALLHKPIITTDTYAIRMYFDEHSCGLIPVGDENAGIAALTKIFNKSEEEIQKQCSLAYNQIKKFSADYCYGLIKNMFL
mgnify:CR=1 FL=1